MFTDIDVSHVLKSKAPALFTKNPKLGLMY